MPTRPSKGDHGSADEGSHGRGGQKATYGSAVSPEVADAQADAITGEHDEESSEDDGEGR